MLLGFFLLLIVAVWFTSFNRRAWKFQAAAHSTSLDLTMQTQTLENRVVIEEAARRAASSLQPASTLDSSRLFAAVDGIRKEAGLPANSTTLGEPRDTGNGQFIVHTLQCNVTRADWDALRRFYAALQQRSPYIAVEQFSLAADRANPALLTASMRISSIEVVK